MGPRAAPLFFFFFSWPQFVFFIFTGLSMPRRPRTCPTRCQRWDGINCPRRLRAFACWPHQSPGGTPRSPRLRFSNCSKQSPKSRHPIEWRAETRRCQPPSFHTNDSGQQPKEQRPRKKMRDDGEQRKGVAHRMILGMSFRCLSHPSLSLTKGETKPPRFCGRGSRSLFFGFVSFFFILFTPFLPSCLFCSSSFYPSGCAVLVPRTTRTPEVVTRKQSQSAVDGC